LFLSAVILSTFFSALISGYLAIVITNNSSSVYKIINLKNYSPVKFYLWSVVSINLFSLIINFILGIIYIYIYENFSNSFYIYLTITLSLSGVIILILIMIKGKINIHIFNVIAIFTFMIALAYPVLLNRIID
tara:strand:+ start:522 stop:920 length:399 start_codon:yes stop_codon:yes gene_type:complete